MTIDEAIKRIQIFVNDVSENAPELLDDALRLSIEALGELSTDLLPATAMRDREMKTMGVNKIVTQVPST